MSGRKFNFRFVLSLVLLINLLGSAGFLPAAQNTSVEAQKVSQEAASPSPALDLRDVSPLSGAETAPQSPEADQSRFAYIYNTDTKARDDFNTFLSGRGYAVDLVSLADASTFDFSMDLAIIIGNDTGSLGTWGTAAAVTHVSASGKPVVGVGEGGHAFFGKLGLDIGYNHGGPGRDKDMLAVDPSLGLFQAPYPITIPPSGLLNIYLQEVSTVQIPFPAGVPAGVTPIGASVTLKGYYDLVSQGSKGNCYTLWGYTGAPSAMTATGQNLFINTLLNQPCGCTLKITKTVEPAGAAASPGDVLNYTIHYEVVGECKLQNVKVSDVLPVPDVTYVVGSASPAANLSGGLLTWDLGDLPAGSKGDLKFQALVNRAVCGRQRVVINYARATAASPILNAVTEQVLTRVNCPPVDFPTDQPPYAESEITVDPYPLVTGQVTKICTTIHNNSNLPQTVKVDFAIANFGIGMPFTSLDASTGNPRVVVIAPHSDVTVCVFWKPTTPGHQCVQVTVSDASVQPAYAPIRSQRNLDVSEVLVPGKPTSFTFPVGNTAAALINVVMKVINTCPGWTVNVDPASFSVAAGGKVDVNVTVTPPPGYVLGSECSIDIQAWEVNEAGALKRLIGGIRKIDEPQIPLGDPQDTPFAEKEIRVTPYPLVSGKITEVCVTLANNTDADQTVTAEFLLSSQIGIGLPFQLIPSISGANPQTVTIPAHSTIDVCIKFIPTAPGHSCLAIKLTLPNNGYSIISRRNLDTAELLQLGKPTDVPILVANPTGTVADIDLVVDNTCPGWTASVSPAVLTNVGPNSGDKRTVILTVTPPSGGVLGTNCHIDLLGYINGQLIGGIRKIDRLPEAPPVDEPHYAEGEILIVPDPPVVGQPTKLCATLFNPTDQDQTLDVTFAAADFGAGIPFTDIQKVSPVTIPAHGSTTVCITWTPGSDGTLHRCIRIQLHKDGYHDLFSQRNIDLVRLNLHIPFDQGILDLPRFIIHNPGPGPDPAPFQFDIRKVGLPGLNFELIDAETMKPVDPSMAILIGMNKNHEFFLRVRMAPMASASQDAAAAPPALLGDHSYVDVIPYVNGQELTVDGVQSAVRFVFETPLIYMPFIHQ